MQTLFNISTNNDTSSDTLLCELGEGFCIISGFDTSSRSIKFLEFYTDSGTSDFINRVLRKIGEKTFSKLVISSAYPHALLVPKKIHRKDLNLVEALSSEETGEEMNDFVGEWNANITHALPAAIHSAISAAYPQAVFMHQYSCVLKVYNGFVASEQLMVNVMPKHFSVLVKKGGTMQLAQTYPYSAPLDVVYYLLKIASELQLSKDNLQLIVSGLVEKDSALYKELYNYFEQVHFALPSGIRLECTDHPSHFFTSTLNLAACVS